MKKHYYVNPRRGITKVNNDMYLVRNLSMTCSGSYPYINPEIVCTNREFCKNNITLEAKSYVISGDRTYQSCCLLIFKSDEEYYARQLLNNLK